MDLKEPDRVKRRSDDDVDAIATIGTADRCIDPINRKIAQGVTCFVCLFTDGGQPATVRLFGEHVLPAFR